MGRRRASTSRPWPHASSTLTCAGWSPRARCTAGARRNTGTFLWGYTCGGWDPLPVIYRAPAGERPPESARSKSPCTSLYPAIGFRWVGMMTIPKSVAVLILVLMVFHGEVFCFLKKTTRSFRPPGIEFLKEKTFLLLIMGGKNNLPDNGFGNPVKPSQI